MNNQKGALLVTVLLMLLVLTLLIVGAMETGVLELKMTNNLQQHQQVFAAAEQGLLAGEKAIKEHSANSCEIPQQAADYFAHRDAKWWRSQASCRFDLDHISIQYVIESLGRDPCAIIIAKSSKSSKNKAGVEYFRITSRSEFQDGKIPVILQTSYAVPANKSAKCRLEEHRKLTRARQSWRQLF